MELLLLLETGLFAPQNMDMIWFDLYVYIAALIKFAVFFFNLLISKTRGTSELVKTALEKENDANDLGGGKFWFLTSCLIYGG